MPATSVENGQKTVQGWAEQQGVVLTTVHDTVDESKEIGSREFENLITRGEIRVARRTPVIEDHIILGRE